MHLGGRESAHPFFWTGRMEEIMAFDFSKLSVRSLSEVDLVQRAWRDADAEFAGKDLRTGEVAFARETRFINPLGDYGCRAVSNGRNFEVLFNGPRADVFHDGLGDHITRQYEDHIDRFGFGTIDAFRFHARVEGYWKRRSWRDRTGQWRIGLDLVAKRWWYQPEGLDLIEEGNAPL